jgi:hypothetical protein
MCAVVKSRIVIASLALVLLGAGVASAAFESGTYTGKTKGQKLAVSFKATQSKLSKLSFKVKFTCTDSDNFTTVLKDFASQNIVDGRYDASYEGSSKASEYRHRGKITGQTAAGSFTGTRRFNQDNKLDPNGTIRCRTGTVRYSIKRKVPKRR